MDLSFLLTFHWPELVTWPNLTDSKKAGRYNFLCAGEKEQEKKIGKHSIVSLTMFNSKDKYKPI